MKKSVYEIITETQPNTNKVITFSKQLNYTNYVIDTK